MQNADLYHQCNSLQKQDALAYLKEYVPKIKWKKYNNRVIDLGCGDGSVTNNILSKYLPTDFTLVGCDISQNMVNFATENYSNKQISFTVLDIIGDHPEVMKEKFDHVFSFYALHWVIDQKRAFNNIFNLLDQEGQCCMIFLAHCSIFDVYRNLSQGSKWSTWVQNVEKHISPYHDSKYPEEEIMKLMQNIGFVNVVVECKEMTFSPEDKDNFKKLIMAIDPFKIPKDKCRDYLEDFVQMLKDIEIINNVNSNWPKGPTIYYKLLRVYGQKPLDV